MHVCLSVSLSGVTYIPGLCGVEGESVATPPQGTGGSVRDPCMQLTFPVCPGLTDPLDTLNEITEFHVY